MVKDEGGAFRHELKYECEEARLRLLQSRTSPFLTPDPHAGPDGTYGIRSVYFDDMYNTCYYENQNGTDPREKFRIRIYNCGADVIRLELKQKVRGKTHKLSCPLTMEQCLCLLKGKLPAPDGAPSPLLEKLCLAIRTRGMRPCVIVDYSRTSLIYPHGNVRVTLDRNIASGFAFDDFFSPSLALRPILPPGRHILEVKFDEFLPDFIHRGLQMENLRQTAFSKYYLCRKYALGESAP